MTKKMERLQFYLEPELNKTLEKAAQESGVSKASLIREGIRQFLARKRPPAEDPLLQLIGGSRSGRKDISKKHDQYLAEIKRTRGIKLLP